MTCIRAAAFEAFELACLAAFLAAVALSAGAWS